MKVTNKGIAVATVIVAFMGSVLVPIFWSSPDNKLENTINNGIITQGQVGNNKINQVPEPEAIITSVDKKKIENGSFKQIHNFSVKNALGRSLRVDVSAQEITAFEVASTTVHEFPNGMSKTGGGTQTGGTTSSEFSSTTIPNPEGAYSITIETLQNVDAKVEFQFSSP